MRRAMITRTERTWCHARGCSASDVLLSAEPACSPPPTSALGSCEAAALRRCIFQPTCVCYLDSTSNSKYILPVGIQKQ